MTKKWIPLFVVISLWGGTAWAQQTAEASKEDTGRGKNSAGYVELNLKPVLGDQKPQVAVFLEGPLIRIAASATAEAKSPLSELFDQLELVQVQVYEHIQDATGLLTATSRRIEELKQFGWTNAVSVPEENEAVDVLVKTSDDTILGLVVLVASRDEVVFVNVAGHINPDVFGKMIGQIGNINDLIDGDFDIDEILFAGKGKDKGEDAVPESCGEAHPKEGQDQK